MATNNQNNNEIINKTFILRGTKIMLDEDVAQLFEIPLKVLRQRVSRNPKRFPDDFRFIPTPEEWNDLCHQMNIATPIGTVKIPAVFTEAGVLMVSGLIKTKKAVQISIEIINQFHSMLESYRNSAK